MLHIHTVPTLRFEHDDQIARGVEMTRLIEEVNRQDAERSSSPDDSSDDDS